MCIRDRARRRRGPAPAARPPFMEQPETSTEIPPLTLIFRFLRALMQSSRLLSASTNWPSQNRAPSWSWHWVLQSWTSFSSQVTISLAWHWSWHCVFTLASTSE
jgi:hypothetical protein